MSLKFIVDSSIGISQAEALKKGLYFVPLAITIGDKTYTEGVDITADEFYKLIDNGPLPKTSQPSPQLYIDAFNEATKDGSDALLLSISSKVSGAFQAANLAKTMCERPEHVYIIDTLSFFGGIQILLQEAEDHSDLPIADLIEYLEDLKGKLRVYAGMDTLTYVYKGGRLSKFNLALGIFLHFKPIGQLEEGVVCLAGKALGTKNAMKFVIDKTKENPIDFSYPCYLLYSSDKTILDRFSSEFFYPEYKDQKDLPIIQIDPLIGSHIGPLVYGLFYVSKEKDETTEKKSLFKRIHEGIQNKLHREKKDKE
jgi:DegV family protein with EDD domain